MDIGKIAESMTLNPGASDDEIAACVNALPFRMPSDFVDFLRQHDGGEGFVGEAYLRIWRVTELADFNSDYQVAIYAPGVFLFGSSGGGEGFGFDTRTEAMEIVMIPFVGMDLDSAVRVAADFSDFFRRLFNGDVQP